ncbi:MAG: flagellar hook-associated family protein [Methylocystis sp.]|uniref:flagellar hook-associated family protein n=1 Tax=Methylocystis sp. TaxID=1911079 RepID=UPI003DA63347
MYLTSTYTMTASLRRTIGLLQSGLTRGQTEVTTGRHADLGLALGSRASESYTLVAARATIQTTLASNSMLTTRLDSTQVALSALLSDAQDIRSTLVGAQTNGGDPGAIVTQAREALTTFVAKLNSSNAEGFLFGGVNTDQEPLRNYFADPPQANKVALDAAFVAQFGFSQSDPAVSTITATQMQNFIDGSFSSLFSAASWKTDWSRASDTPIRSQVSLSASVDASVTANEPALQKLAAAYTMLSDLGTGNLAKDSYGALLKSAMVTIDSGIRALTKTQARLGVIQSTVKSASETMTIQSSTLESQLNGLESVDPAEASTRVHGLMTQIETAYALTARISQLSLIKYL